KLARYPPAVPNDGKVAVLPDEILVQIFDGREGLTFLLSGKPFLRIGEIPRARGAIPHWDRQTLRLELRFHVDRHIPRIQAGARHSERGQTAFDVINGIQIDGDAPLTIVRGPTRTQRPTL